MGPQVIVLTLLVTMTALFVQGRFRYDMIALGGLLVLAVTGVLPAKDVFSGLAHPVILTVGAVLLLSQGLQNCGVVDAVANRVAALGWRPSFQIALLVVLVTVLSAFVNNIGALSLLLPVGLRLAKRYSIAPSSFIMCLAFGAILGGLFCLISTPVNLLISGIRATTLGEGFSFFDFTPVGLCVIAVGLLYMLGPGRKLLPHYPDAQDSGGVLDMGAFATELVVKDDSSIAGQTLAQITAFREHSVVVTSIVRGASSYRRIDGGTQVLAGDRLIVECDPTNLSEATAATGTELVTPKEPSEQAAIGWEVLEAVVPPGSELVGKTVRQVNLRYQFSLNLVGVARKGTRIRTRLSQTPFKAGDILLLQGAAPAFRQAAEELGLLQLATRDVLSPPHLRPMWLGLSVFVGTILLAAFSILPVEQAFVLGAFLMIASGALPSQQAYTVIDLPLLILLACMLPLGKALETSGAAATLAQGLVTVSGQLPDRGILVVFVGLTALLANLMNNKAATAIMAPLAIQLATELGWDPDTLLMGAAVGAELVFLSPVGHQCNLLVLGPGSYSFKDFLRFGVPMVVLGLTAAVIALPIFWPPH